MAKDANPRSAARHPAVRARARERWERIVDEWRRTGLGVRAFCRKRGLSEHSFYVWRRKLSGAGTAGRRDGELAAAREAGFLPVRVVSRGPAAAGIEIEFPTGHVIRAGADADPEALARAVALLDPSRC
jgi:transposase-like protein